MDDKTRKTITDQIAAFNAEVATIRADPMLSELGKSRAIKELHSTTTASVDGLKGQAEASTYTRRTALERRLFGISPGADASSVISYRDAADRVGQITDPQELAQLMERAASTGDDVLLKVAAKHAHSNSTRGLGSDLWDTLVQSYVEDSGAGDDFAEYESLTSSRGLTERFAERVETSVPVPDEVRSTSHLEANLSDEVPRWRPGYEAPALPEGLPLRDFTA